MDHTSEFIAAALKAMSEPEAAAGKCTLSKPSKQAPEGLKNVYLRPVLLKKGLRIAFNHRYAHRDEVKNLTLDETEAQLRAWLGTVFGQAELVTPDRQFSLTITPTGVSKLRRRAATGDIKPISISHDRTKKRLLDPSAPWLHALGLTNAKGEVLPTAQDKWKQINKFLEIVAALLEEKPLPVAQTKIVDMGSGKGYLTFALYDYLSRQGFENLRVTGIELRPALVEFCEKTARQVEFSGLHFVAADIAEYDDGPIDMLIALHACDIATDLALAKGIWAQAGIIVAAPCCHKQIRKDMATQNELGPLMRHGILEERQAELLTDGIRALLLESKGYRTRVFEFVSTEHTAKNIMITAVAARNTNAEKAKAQIEALKTGFGIKTHYLETLLD